MKTNAWHITAVEFEHEKRLATVTFIDQHTLASVDVTFQVSPEMQQGDLKELSWSLEHEAQAQLQAAASFFATESNIQS